MKQLVEGIVGTIAAVVALAATLLARKLTFITCYKLLIAQAASSLQQSHIQLHHITLHFCLK